MDQSENPKAPTLESLLAMPLGASTDISCGRSYFTVVRFVGGWVYESYRCEDGETAAVCFVPEPFGLERLDDASRLWVKAMSRISELEDELSTAKLETRGADLIAAQREVERDEVRTAAHRLYRAGKWELPGMDEKKQAKLWEALRDAIYLPEDTTGEGEA